MGRFLFIDTALRDLTGHHYPYAVSTIEAAHRSGYRCLLLCHSSVRLPVESCEILPIYTRSFREALEPPAWFARLFSFRRERTGSQGASPNAALPAGTCVGRMLLRWTCRLNWLACARSFARETRTELRRLGAGQGDVVFMAAVSSAVLRGLSECLRRDKLFADVSWHLLIRREPHEDDFAEELRRLPSERIHLYTDTGELTAAYQSLGIRPFSTLPIPHVASNPRPQGPESPLRIVYFGDARREKGYDRLPKLIRESWGELVEPGDVRFIVQSNFNTERGEPGIDAVRRDLESLPPWGLTTLRDPLDPRAYRALLLGAEIGLLPYRRDPYRARSSGVLAELLASGVPVLVPAGTWLSRQLAPAMRQHFREIRQRSHGFGLSQTQDPRLELIVPKNADHLWLEAAEGAEVTVSSNVGRRILLDSSSPTALIHLPRGRPGLTIEFSPANASARSIRFEFLECGEAVPLSAVGMPFVDESDLPFCLREMIRRHAHYWTTARRFAVEFRKMHGADRLIEELRSCKENLLV